MMTKILLAVDGSDCSLRAVDHLLELIAAFSEAPEIHLLYVQPPIPMGGVLAHVSKETLDAHYREEAEHELAAARQRLAAAGVPYILHIHVGQAAPLIVKLAGELGCRLIAMGAHGRGALAGALCGSVTTRVMHLSHLPVMVIK
ncbi:MAG: universal stress protein [Rhodocyclales bacterium]|nr:universal stress protein [Rhodocyclales bacterium]